MATVGQQLLTPEEGWKRHDNTDSNINYIGSWSETTPSTVIGTAYSGSYMYNGTIGNCVRFKFTGSIIRIIHYCWNDNSSNIEVNIDGDISTYSAAYINKNQVLVFEKLDLSDGEHYIILTNKTSAYQTFDAIDIDENGKLLPYNPDEKSDQTLLRVTMLDSSERDYQLPTTEIEGFINWFNNHTSTSSTSYMLNKKVGTQNSKEYLSFDKIISIEVLELK